MPATSARCPPLPGPVAGRRCGRWWVALCLCWALAAGLPLLARAQGVDLASLTAERTDGGLTLDFAVRINLPRAAEDALVRGVPLYFLAEATLLRSRWYWRDQRVTRVSRSWRVAYQPLTNTWRVSLAGLNQNFPTLPEALSAVSRSAGWPLAEHHQLEVGKDYYVQFSYRLDTTQLPGPMQFGLGGGDWAVGVSREVTVPP